MITKKDIKAGKYPVNFATFNKVFDEQYRYFYGHEEREEERAENTAAFDEKLNSNPLYRLLVRLSYEIRRDSILSDREAAAFNKTVDILGVKFD